MQQLEQPLDQAGSPVVAGLWVAAALASLVVGWALAARLRRGLPLLAARIAPPARWSGVDVAAVFATVIVTQVLAAAVVPEDAPLSSRLAASIVGMTVAALVGLWHLRSRGATWDELGMTVADWRHDLRLAVIGLGLVLWPLLALATLLDRIQPYAHPIIDYVSTHRDPAAIALVILSAVVVAPLVEEFLFRRVLQGWLVERFGGDAGAAICLQALAFGLAHAGQGLAPVPLALFGMVLGGIVFRTGSLLPAVVLHGLFNAASIALVLAGGGPVKG
ncbi:MAG: CPBP family intramembrane metalloprotease [Planctomycetes bacterium]|nr:CPBP family intramembrane metalloprotease [Planctomycetota bacterium]